MLVLVCYDVNTETRAGRRRLRRVAKLCEGVEDILSEFEYLFPASNRPATAAGSGVLPALELSPNEQKVYDALRLEDEKKEQEDRMIRELEKLQDILA